VKVTNQMTNESGNAIAADFLDIDGCGILIEADGDLAKITLDSTAWPNVTGRFSAQDLYGIMAKCAAVAGQIARTHGIADPYADEIKRLFTRERGKLMEITPEMIAAVKAHEAAEQKRKEEEYRDERIRKQRERDARLKTGALAQARTVAPYLTEDQFGNLEDIFYEYLQEKYDW
jgi:hypothetical protein